jgi:glutaconate CoA-transferase subunit A
MLWENPFQGAMNQDISITGKFMTPAEAVSRFFFDGAQIALGGFTIARNSMAIVHEVIRQRIRDLHVVCHSQAQALDLLIGAGCVRRLEIAYGGAGRFAPTCIRFRKAVENREIAFEDYSNYQMSLRFLAGALGIPFIPGKSGLGTDILRREGFSREVRAGRKTAAKKFVLLQNPFAEEPDPLVLLPAITPDVALVHAQQVGEDGTVRIRGLTFADIEQAKSADAVIVTCEEILPVSRIRDDPDRNSLPPFLVDAVVLVPFGAHPTACPFYYDYDAAHLNRYRKMAEDDRLFERYLSEWIYGLKDHQEYLDRVGREQLEGIRADPVLGYRKGLERR